MREAIVFAIALVVLAAVGHSLSHPTTARHLPLTTVLPRTCEGVGPITAVLEYEDQPGVLHVQCAGRVWLIGSK